jgi:SAM-dependent methyltransferase
MDQPDIRDRLLAHFSVPADDFNSRWSSLWDTGDFLPWDQGAPSPALSDILQGRKDLFGDSVFVDGRRKRALVAGCGRGYDVLLLASFGYDAYGLDISEAAVKKCEGFASEHAAEYPAKDAGVGAGKVKFISGDFFTGDWEGTVEGGATFELIYDYTVLYLTAQP